MGFVRKFFLVLASMILASLLIVANILFTISWSLNPDSIKPQFSSLAKDILFSQSSFEKNLNEVINDAKTTCKTYSFIRIDTEQIKLEIPCTAINNGANATVDYALNQMFEGFYYKDYNCKFFECTNQTMNGFPSVLLSEKAKEYWNQKFILSLIIAIILIIAVFLLTVKKSNAFINLGSLFILSAFPLLSIKHILSIFSGNVISKGISVFFTRAISVFWIILIIGISLIATGIALKITGLMNHSEKEEPVQKKKSK